MTSILDVAPDASCHDADQDAALKPSNFSPISDRARLSVSSTASLFFVGNKPNPFPMPSRHACPLPQASANTCAIVLTAGFLKGLDEQAGLMDVFFALGRTVGVGKPIRLAISRLMSSFDILRAIDSAFATSFRTRVTSSSRTS